jgi:acetyl-CoA acyltransferase
MPFEAPSSYGIDRTVSQPLGRDILERVTRTLREVVYVDGVRTAFGRAAPEGLFSKTRADDMVVKIVRELLRRHPSLPAERIGDVVIAATAQVGDQGLTLGRDVALLAGLPHTVPGFAVDRMCAGALTATTAGAGEIAMGACDVVIAGGVEHMGHHPMGAEVDFNPRFVAERLIDESAAVMGKTAENLHDVFPHITKEQADSYAVASQHKAAAAWDRGVMDGIVVPMSVFTDDGWTVARRDEFLRPGTTLEGLASLRTPFRAGGRVTAGNSAGLTDGATACILTAEKVAAELGLEPAMRLLGFAYAGVEPDLMGIGPIPSTQRVLEQTGLSLDDIGLFELNEPFAVQVLTWCDGMGIAPDDPRLNPYGGAIACGHPLAATGIRLLAQLAHGFGERPDVRYGLTALCIGMGMGATLLWENVRHG